MLLVSLVVLGKKDLNFDTRVFVSIRFSTGDKLSISGSCRVTLKWYS